MFTRDNYIPKVEISVLTQSFLLQKKPAMICTFLYIVFLSLLVFLLAVVVAVLVLLVLVSLFVVELLQQLVIVGGSCLVRHVSISSQEHATNHGTNPLRILFLFSAFLARVFGAKMAFATRRR